jgi:hypothetical protein
LVPEQEKLGINRIGVGLRCQHGKTNQPQTHSTEVRIEGRLSSDQIMSISYLEILKVFGRPMLW